MADRKRHPHVWSLVPTAGLQWYGGGLVSLSGEICLDGFLLACCSTVCPPCRRTARIFRLLQSWARRYCWSLKARVAYVPILSTSMTRPTGFGERQISDALLTNQ